MSVMLVAAIIDDPLGIVLAIGVLVSASSAVVYFTGRPTRDGRAKPPTRPAARVAPGEIMSASSALARAQAAALERSAASDGYKLTGVRAARPPLQIAALAGLPVLRSTPPTSRDEPAGGQPAPRADGDGSERDVVTAQSRAIAFHIAETDPQRMAEVIRTWIRQDVIQQDRARADETR
jgi:hypothetical protein